MPENSETWSPSESLLELMKTFAAPQLTETALDARFGPRNSWILRPGHIWRVRSRSTSALVMIVKESGGQSVLCTPVSFETEVEDPNSAVTVQADGAFASPMTIWKDLTREVPLRFFDQPVGDLGEEISLWIQNESGLPENFRLGSPISRHGDLESRAQIEDELSEICKEPGWNELTDPAENKPMRSPVAQDFEELSARMGLTIPEVLDAVDGKIDFTTIQQEIIRDVLGGLPRPISIPIGLVVEIDHPRALNLVKDVAENGHLPDGKAREHIARQILAQAARQTGGGEVAWKARFDQWVNSRQTATNE